MKIVSKTDIGLVRHSNQDSYAAGEMPGGVAWAIVCDGMGGANGGNIASATAVKMISEIISTSYREGMSSNSIRTVLQSAIYSANVSIYDKAQQVEELRGMGTTVVAAMVSEGRVHVAHAGDSRAYLLGKGELTQLTKDHSVVQSMMEDGSLTEREAKTHPRKNIITRALGVEESIEIDYNEVELGEDQQLLICTDGLTNYVDTDEVLQITGSCEFYDYPERLTQAALENGGGDNITVVVISN